VITKFPVALVACLLLSTSSKVLAQESNSHPRLISVVGTAEIKVAPDEAILSLGVESQNIDLLAAKSQHDARVKKLLGLARDTGVEEKYIQTSALTMGPNYSYESGKRKWNGYEVSQSISITLKDLSKYEALMTKFLQAGVNRVDGVSFLVAEPNKYKADARLKAIRAAKEKATAMASELGQTVGKPFEVSEEAYEDGFLNIRTRSGTNSISNSAVATTEESTVAPGVVTIRASIRISFQLE